MSKKARLSDCALGNDLIDLHALFVYDDQCLSTSADSF